MKVYEYLTIKFSNLDEVKTVLKNLITHRLISFGPLSLYHGKAHT